MSGGQGHLPAELHEATAGAIAAAVTSGAIAAREAVSATIVRCRKRNPALNAFTEFTEQRALAEAEAVDARQRAGAPLGPLAGVPYAVKNLFDLQGLPTFAGARMYRGAEPAAEDATLVTRFQAADAAILGALNMGEFAYDFTGENAAWGPSRNPHAPEHMAGGSSGGAAAAVAAGLVPLAMGSDTNGSIRVPAAFCGMFGLKPTYGRLPRTGTFPFADSLDTLGFFARSAEDLALAFDATQGVDPRDPACVPDESRLDARAAVTSSAPGLRVARLEGWFRGRGEPETDAAADLVARSLGADDSLQLDDVEAAQSAAYVITNVEAAALHLPDLRTRPEAFDPAVRDRLLAGALMPGVHYVRAQRFRRAFQASIRRVFERVDLLVAPATPMRAPEIGAQTCTIDGAEAPLRPNIGIYTQPISFVGLPVVLCPVQWPGDLPAGVQLVAPAWREDIALSAAGQLERLGMCKAPSILAGTG